MLKCFCEEPMGITPDAEHWYATSCGHMFHHLCLINWLERSKTCPQCRKPVQAGQMFRLYPTEWEEKPKDEINEVLQICLDDTQAQLNNMTNLCKKKDGVISNLKIDADNERNFRRENKALKSVLQTFDGDSLDELFDDPDHFDEVLKGKVALIQLEERAQQGSEQEVVIHSDTEASVGAEAQPRTGAGNAGALGLMTNEETEAIVSSLDTMRNMLERISEITNNDLQEAN